MLRNNIIQLKGIIKNITFQHTIGNTEFYKANLICKDCYGYENIIPLKFKKFSNPYSENDLIEIQGNIRQYSHKQPDNTNRVEVYVFTYFDLSQPDLNGNIIENQFIIDGRICKIESLHKTKQGRKSIHFILANNIKSENAKLNSYIPMVAWDDVAEQISTLQVNSEITVIGQLHSREYKKQIGEQDYKIRIAHEGVVTSLMIKD